MARTATESQVIYTTTLVEWPASVPDAGLLLTVSGPGGLYLRQENPAGSWGRFTLLNEQGQPRPDGIYKWELIRRSGWETPDDANLVQSGWFEIQNGKVVAEGIGEIQSVVVEEQAPANSLYVDNQGRVGLGTSVPASELHLKGILPALTLEDTTTGGGVFTWRGLENGDGSLALFDKTGQARWLVDSEGRIGIGTTKPTSTLTVDGYIEATKGFLVNGRPVQPGFFGGGASLLATEGSSNNFFGTGAGASNTIGKLNAFFGGNAGYSNTSGQQNSFFGIDAGYRNTTANFNSFFGAEAGYSNTTGYANSIFGSWAGPDNTVGYNNSFFGHTAARLNTEGHDNSFFGMAAGNHNTMGNFNSFFGNFAGYSNTTASGNSFFGGSAGYNNTGGQNSFFGMTAGYSNTTGSNNSFFGNYAGYLNTDGVANSFFGASAGYNNSSGHRNSFFGFSAGSANTTGSDNSFFGRAAGSDNRTGGANSFFGGLAGQVNTTGSNNSFFGYSAGQLNQTGYGNSAFGTVAGFSNTIGYDNSFFGWTAGYSNSTGNYNSAFGLHAGYANTVENQNTFVGYYADVNPGTNPATNPVTNATAIGALAYVAQSNSLVLGSTPNVNGAYSYVNVGIGTPTPYYSIHVVRTGANAAVVTQRTDGATNYMNASATFANFGSVNNFPLRLMVNGTWRMRLDLDNSLSMVNGASCTAGGVWTNGSSREYKENISALSSEEAMETLDGLSPVKFNYKADQTETYVGFIAEDVPDLVATNDRKSLSPMDIVAVLARVVQEQQKTIEDQQKAFDSLKAEVETLKALLQGR